MCLMGLVFVVLLTYMDDWVEEGMDYAVEGWDDCR